MLSFGVGFERSRDARNAVAGWMSERFGERTFRWLNKFRRLSKDYEFRTDSSQAFIFFAASSLLIALLA